MASPKRLPPLAELSLDEQIALAEAQVITRDTRIRRRTDAVFSRIKHEAVKHAGGGALIGAATVALAWWLKRLSRKHAPAPQPATAAPQQEEQHATFEHLFRDVSLTLAGLLPVLWPILPRHWRRMVTPGTASTVLTFVAPILGKLLRRKPRETQTS